MPRRLAYTLPATAALNAPTPSNARSSEVFEACQRAKRGSRLFYLYVGVVCAMSEASSEAKMRFPYHRPWLGPHRGWDVPGRRAASGSGGSRIGAGLGRNARLAFSPPMCAISWTRRYGSDHCADRGHDQAAGDPSREGCRSHLRPGQTSIDSMTDMPQITSLPRSLSARAGPLDSWSDEDSRMNGVRE